MEVTEKYVQRPNAQLYTEAEGQPLHGTILLAMGATASMHFGGISTLDWTSREAVTAFLLRIAELSAGPDRPFDREAALGRIGRELDQTASMQSAFNHAMLAGNIDPKLKAQDIVQPTLVIHGGADPLISIAAADARSGPQCRADGSGQRGA